MLSTNKVITERKNVLDELLMERYDLAKNRICEICTEKSAQPDFEDFFKRMAEFLKKTAVILERQTTDQTEEELMQVDEIGARIAGSVRAYFAHPSTSRLIARLKEAGVQMELSAERLADRTDRLQGATVVISGMFTLHSRDEYKTLIEQHGGKNTASVSAKTTYLLAGENMGPAKLEKATKLGIKIISEDEFLQLIASEE